MRRTGQVSWLCVLEVASHVGIGKLQLSCTAGSSGPTQEEARMQPSVWSAGVAG